jgi:hypothetical protein
MEFDYKRCTRGMEVCVLIIALTFKGELPAAEA